MSIQSDIVAALNSASLVKVFPGEAPEGTELPYIVYIKVASDPVNTLAGYAGVTKSTFLFECWADTYAGAVALADQVRTAIQSAASLVKFIEPSDQDDHEPATDDYVEPVLFSFWHS